MSAAVSAAVTTPDPQPSSNDAAISQSQPVREVTRKNYQGFVAGVFSGIAKLSVGHPFDTIKVRLQTTKTSRFRGPIDCVYQTIHKEGVKGLYKGATPPLIGWMFMDSVMLGSLTMYRRVLNENVFNRAAFARGGDVAMHTTADMPRRGEKEDAKLPVIGHGIAGLFAGWTVSFVAAPVEHIKARLQIQYSMEKNQRLYSGPIDCMRKISHHHGITGLYHGLSSTILFRSFFFVWWSSYDLISTSLRTHFPSMSAPSLNFWAGGLSAQLFWISSYPSDVVKQRVMTDPLGGGLADGERRFRGSLGGWSQAAKAVWTEGGAKGFWRGFGPCFLRAFPANGAALVAFEGVMRTLGSAKEH